MSSEEAGVDPYREDQGRPASNDLDAFANAQARENGGAVGPAKADAAGSKAKAEGAPAKETKPAEPETKAPQPEPEKPKTIWLSADDPEHSIRSVGNGVSLIKNAIAKTPALAKVIFDQNISLITASKKEYAEAIEAELKRRQENGGTGKLV